MPFRFDNSYQRLPERFYQRIDPVPVRSPALVCFNAALGEELGASPDAAVFAGNEIPEGASPIAMAYAGHQFGHFVPQLGDGRAVLLGEVIGKDGVRRDIQLKGSGQTAFSRRGDGRAALGPMLREYIMSEAMHALGIPTTRSLAVATTGEAVVRDAGPLQGAVLTRVAKSHLRVGTFEYFSARGDHEALKMLADYAIDRLYPAAKAALNPYRALIESVSAAQAALVAQWMGVGFLHGVISTDNTAISGETIDYGPCAFLDHYDPLAVFSSIDRYGRYAFGNQAPITRWNLEVLAEAMLPLLDPEGKRASTVAREALEPFDNIFRAEWLTIMRHKLGFFRAEDGDEKLVNDLLSLMRRHRADYTLAFRYLGDAHEDDSPFRSLFAPGPEVDSWLGRWRGRQDMKPADAAKAMHAVNPAVIPRNHRVEEALRAAEGGDLSIMERLTAALAKPYEANPAYMIPPAPEERVCATFCGT